MYIKVQKKVITWQCDLTFFTARRYAASSCVSICLSLTPGIVSKRLNLESRNKATR